MAPVIETQQLTKTYAGNNGIHDLDLLITPGEIFGYLGPNGSGKTTTIRLLLGLIRPDRGKVRLFDQPASASTRRLRARIGYAPGEASIPENMSGARLLRWYARLSGSRAPLRDSLCKQLSLSDKDLQKPIRALSRGTKQKLILIQALQHNPDLVILDEPTTGLDPLAQEAFFDILLDLRDQGRTIFFSSHILSEVQRLCDRVAVLREGRLVLQSTMMEMAAQADRLLWIKFRQTGQPSEEESPAQAEASAPRIPGARFIRVDSGGWLLYLAPAGESRQLLHELARIDPLDFRLEPALEESFLRLYGVRVSNRHRPEEAAR